MKNSKLIDIFRCGNIVIPLYIFKRFKEFKISMEEFIFLMFLYNLGDKSLFNPNEFADSLGLELTDVMGYVSNLTEKHLIRVEVVKNDKGLREEVVLLDDFYNKLSMITTSDIVNKNSEDSNIFEIIEKEFGRTLSPIEYEIIKAWLDNNIEEVLIKEAIKEATFNGVSNLRYIDKILYEWGKKGIKTVEDIEANRRKRIERDKDALGDDVDLDMVDWNWFDEE